MMKLNYSGVFFDDTTKTLLREWVFSSGYLEDINLIEWKFIGDHYTICMGKLPEIYKKDIGSTILIKAVSIGFTDKAIALKVECDVNTHHTTPHITLFVNKNNGATPYDSTYIDNWTELYQPIFLIGIIRDAE